MLRPESPPEPPPKLVGLGVFGGESRLLPQQLHGERVRHHHDNHGDVESHQRSEDEERPVVYHTQAWFRHDVVLMSYAWKTPRDSCVSSYRKHIWDGGLLSFERNGLGQKGEDKCRIPTV